MSLWIAESNISPPVESVLTGFDHYLAIDNFSILHQQFQLAENWDQVLMVQPYVLLSA
jgi:hypothetical protein